MGLVAHVTQPVRGCVGRACGLPHLRADVTCDLPELLERHGRLFGSPADASTAQRAAQTGSVIPGVVQSMA